jgi:hypothetical protein
MQLLRELHCSLQETNPGVPLVVLGAKGDLDDAIIDEISKLDNTHYHIVEELTFQNKGKDRFSLNWIKLRAWELEQYSAIIMLDVDMSVKGQVTQLFSLPTDFAWATNQGPNGYIYNAGGFQFLRPCKAVFNHMLQLLKNDTDLPFPRQFAEQSFLNWYMGYTGMRLPMIYNTNFKFVKNQTGVAKVLGSGAAPLVIHFADVKPFTPTMGTKEWPYLCHASKHPNDYQFTGHNVTFYSKCPSGKGSFDGGQYATFGLDGQSTSNVATIHSNRLHELRLRKKINYIVHHVPRTEVQLFDHNDCEGRPLFSSTTTQCLIRDIPQGNANNSSLGNRAVCVRIRVADSGK